ncbi:hypothetical protein L204_101653 [Cryptococcus depauperatus]|nr:solute carrier family 35, member C2 [Cryptococcus depauperatus CBS 7855]
MDTPARPQSYRLLTAYDFGSRKEHGPPIDSTDGLSQLNGRGMVSNGRLSLPRLSMESESGMSPQGEDLGFMSTSHVEHKHASLAMKKALWWRDVAITGMFILSWYTFASLLSLYNKWMFSAEYYNFPFPLFVTSCHMLVQFGMAAVIRIVWREKFRPKERPTRKDYLTRILPTAAATGGDIGLSNLSLKTITLSLYTMCKSSLLIFVLIFAFAFHLEAYSLRLISVITLISFGVFCMVFNATVVSIPGIIMVFFASALGGLRWALTELVMKKKSIGLSNPFATIFWLAPLMAVTLGLVSMIVEGWFKIFGSDFFEGWRAFTTIGVIVLPGVIAFTMVTSEYFIIQRSGAVPLSIVGIFKEVSTISLSSWMFGDQLTAFNIVGVVITIIGIALYSYHQYQKSMTSTIGLDAAPRKSMNEDDSTSLMPSSTNRLAATAQDDPDDMTGSNEGDVQLSNLLSHPSLPHSPMQLERLQEQRNREEEELNRREDNLEGWDRPEEWSEDEEEISEDEVQQRRGERKRSSKRNRWTDWLNKGM